MSRAEARVLLAEVAMARPGDCEQGHWERLIEGRRPAPAKVYRACMAEAEAEWDKALLDAIREYARWDLETLAERREAGHAHAVEIRKAAGV